MGRGRPSIPAQARALLGGLLALVTALLKLTAAELKANAGQLRAPLLALLAALALAFTALVLLLVAAVLGLAQFLPAWAAALIVALLAGGAALALARNALSRLGAVSLAPARAMTTLQAQIDRLSATAKDKTHAE
ncbi:MAG: phage holin family protein [Alphaproteobacteria bacterium]|nr:phage holin family protein [Alphaproteobacteria bacterium]